MSLYLSASALDVIVSGKVTGTGGAAVAGALVTIVNAGMSGITDAQGAFALNASSPLIYRLSTTADYNDPVVSGSFLQFTVQSLKQVRINVYDLHGNLLATVIDKKLQSGTYQCAPVSLVNKRLAPTMYIAELRNGTRISRHMVLHTGSAFNASLVHVTSVSGRSALGKSAAGVDFLEVAAEGYKVYNQELSSYTANGLNISLTAITVVPGKDNYLDSLFRTLIDRAKSLDSLDSMEQARTIDFESLRAAFDAFIKNNDPYNTKANVGLMLSTMLALNTSDSLWKMVDSLDAYFEAVDRTDSIKNAQEPGLGKALASSGAIGLGKALAVKTPQVLMAAIQEPSFPQFVKLSYVQKIAETEVIPALDNVVRAAERIENDPTPSSMVVVVEGDSFDLDRGDIYVFDAGVRLLRAYLNMFCTYNIDIYAPGTTNYTWIDSVRLIKDDYREIFKLNGDTLIRIGVDGFKGPLFGIRTLKYNMNRADFLTIRKTNHAKVKSDLQAVPLLIKAGIGSIRLEKGDQSRGVIKISDITDADSGLVDLRQDMIDDGVSAALADKFKSPESVADFVKELLSGPYTFDETIDSQRVLIKINLSAMFDNPVQDLRTLLPKYRWEPESTWVKWEMQTNDVKEEANRTIYYCDEDSLAIDSADIDSIGKAPESMGKYICYLKSAAKYVMWMDSTVNLWPISLLDNTGAVITKEEMDSLAKADSFFPYFDDYTIHGLFPDMTRAKWLDLVGGKDMQ